MKEIQKREAWIIGLCLLAGGVAAILVYVGDEFRWHHFSRRTGYFGAGFIDSFLYAINDPYAIHIVAFLWFTYAAGFLYILLWIIRKSCGLHRS